VAEQPPEGDPRGSPLNPVGIDAEDPEAARFRGAEPFDGEEPPSQTQPARRDLVVIGASAGGVEALARLVRGFPPELPAAVIVVLHLPAGGRSVLPAILARAGGLPATVPHDGERPERGHIYVAPPDRHLLLVGQQMRLTGGPRENGHRPAIDPLFRSAARTYGARVVAVVLSGNLDDGAAGSRLVKERGGMVLVQDPEDALYPDMPASAAAVTDVDALVPMANMAGRICAALEEPLPKTDEHVIGRETGDEEEELAAAELALDGQPTELSCPECGGPLWERSEGPLVRFACRVGHVFSPESLIEQHGKELERALWSAQRNLEERADLYRRMARRARAKSVLQKRFLDRSASAERHAAAVQDAIVKLTSSGEVEEAS
jgi:two-component system, chemotaxis family, protein-glutamate methylesterase/glutaminase